ncbi:hypothetical protein DSO57_1030069 [Entomophthora muscae]|uniref:Uncharacterized protein n=1 Tax=Entomophthora muscae TaxID=34485 RepID=A0ACC2S360_9FUNG|nr:hypothetical protein DSO57_1030069 [Entomophthora muscae]
MIIYASKNHLKVLKDQEVIHMKVENRVVSLIYRLIIGTKQVNYVRTLKIIKK